MSDDLTLREWMLLFLGAWMGIAVCEAHHGMPMWGAGLLFLGGLTMSTAVLGVWRGFAEKLTKRFTKGDV